MSQEQSSVNKHKIYKINPSLTVSANNTLVQHEKRAANEKNENNLPRVDYVSSSIIDVTNSSIASSNTNFQVT
jgi:hypothetical protein